MPFILDSLRLILDASYFSSYKWPYWFSGLLGHQQHCFRLIISDGTGMLKCWDVTNHQEKSSRRKRENQQETQITWHRLRDSNPGYTGWKRVLSLLRRPVSGKEKRQVFTWCMGIVQRRFMCSVPVSVICVPMHHAPNTWNVSSYVSFFLRVKLGNGCNRHVPCSFSELKFVGSRHWKLGENVFHELRYMKYW